MTSNPVNTIAGQMLEVLKSGTEKIHVCYWDGTVEARPSKHILEVHPIFGIWTAAEIQKGLTAQQWRALGERVG